MKSLKVIAVVTVIFAALLSTGLVYALNSDQATARAIFPSQTLTAGQTETVYIFFASTNSDDLVVTHIGINFDWMPSDTFAGVTLTNPVPIPSGGDHLFPSMAIQIPSTTTNGEHSYYVGIDGTEGASETPFSWSSSPLTVVVQGGSNSTPTTSPTSGGQPGGNSNLLIYAAIAVVVVVVVLLAILLLMRKRRTQPKRETKQTAEKPEAPTPEKKPSPEQDFNI